eukprot:TRINITY_DN23212_c0_g1_i4.p1 TRINITY_DN23212_c0_g1~~TRINITY_DN23212_c0_g1_i4.p1  ORF type:complete len:200 (+),score=19.66 TRINITY_DN23212_c0_g1_i4:59-658(+)
MNFYGNYVLLFCSLVLFPGLEGYTLKDHENETDEYNYISDSLYDDTAASTDDNEIDAYIAIPAGIEFKVIDGLDQVMYLLDPMDITEYVTVTGLSNFTFGYSSINFETGTVRLQLILGNILVEDTYENIKESAKRAYLSLENGKLQKDGDIDVTIQTPGHQWKYFKFYGYISNTITQKVSELADVVVNAALEYIGTPSI